MIERDCKTCLNWYKGVCCVWHCNYNKNDKVIDTYFNGAVEAIERLQEYATSETGGARARMAMRDLRDILDE